MSTAQKSESENLRDAEGVIRQKNARIALLEKELRSKTFERDSAERIRTEIYGLSEYSPEPPDWLNQEPKKGTSSSGVPIISLNDWHWGELVDPDQVGGCNKYNRSIAKKRVRILYETVNDLCFNHMTNPNYPGAVVAILGDMITGAIHEELAESNDGPVQISVLEVEDNLIGLIKGWAKKFGKLAVICVPGNHGRNTIRPRFKNRVFDSYEWNIYQHIERFFRNDPRVSVYVPNEVDAHFAIMGHRFMVTHGDTLGVKGGDGIIGPLGPIARGVVKLMRSEASIGRPFDTALMGHYHFYMPRGDGCPALVSPSLIGVSEYSRLQLRAPFTRPAQALAFLHHKHGFTAQWPMYVDGKKLNPKSAPWFVWEGRPIGNPAEPDME